MAERARGLSRAPSVPTRVYRLVRRVDGAALAALDVTVVASAYLLGIFAGFEGNPSDAALRWLWLVVTAAVLIQLLVNRRLGLYRAVWRHASLEEAVRIVAAVGIGVTVTLVAMESFQAAAEVSLPAITTAAVASLIMLIGMGGTRFQARLFALERRRRPALDRPRTVIVGAGEAGSTVAIEATRDPSITLDIVGFVDDDAKLLGRSVRGVPVLGPTPRLAELCTEHDVDRILVAIPSATAADMSRILRFARAADAQIKVLPTPHEMLNGPLLANVRDIDVTDLLGREQVQIDTDEVEAMLGGATVLITGAGGSIGSEIARQVSAFAPRALLLLDHDETHLHDLLADGRVDGTAVLADIRDAARMRHVLATLRPDVVFHAAAHKHVPMLEHHPGEAVRTNVLGTHNVVAAAAEAGVGHFVHISTDKAADPCSVMGATKRVAELVVHDVGRTHGLAYVAVRFGNVLNSRGSVAPTFLAQILRGGPVTVTHPEMNRYFMSIPEAVLLVLQAGALAERGDILLLDMGDPVSINDLALQMIRLAGLRPHVDVAIEEIGLRPGERLHERLVDEAEDVQATTHPSLRRLVPKVRPDPAALAARLDDLRLQCDRNDDERALELVQGLLCELGIDCRLAGRAPVGTALAKEALVDLTGPVGHATVPHAGTVDGLTVI
ncbi:nucleoside-diphosphate sugar epimerase/dehydratase [soil metagenome]